MSNIPAARELITEVLDSVDLTPNDADKLTKALSLMTRKASGPRAPIKHHSLTPKEASEVRRLAALGRYTQTELAQRFNVNAGRISEAIRGAR